METLQEFRKRTAAFMKNSITAEKEFVTSEGLRYKVNADGSLRPFAGDTVVFLLEDTVKSRLEKMQERLYRTCGKYLAQPFHPSTFHVTLHDLSNGMWSGELGDQLLKNERAVGRIFGELADEGVFRVKMRTSYVFNMVNTSVVLGLEPVREEDCRRLMELYERFQQVIFLPYPLTPHVTLAYYRPGILDAEVVKRLREWMQEESAGESLDVELDLNQLVYQRFSDMGQYWTVF